MRYWALTVLLAVACSAPEKPKPQHPTSHGDPGLARALIGQADDATKAGDFDKARKLLKRAESYADVPARADIDAQYEATDEAEAESLAEEPKAAAKKGDCKAAIDASAELMGKSEGIAKFLPAHVGKSIAKCVKKLALDDDKLAEARKLLDADGTDKVVGAKHYKALHKDVMDLVEAAVDKQVTPLIDKKDFPGAAAAIAAMTQSGVLTEDDAEKVRDKMREAIAAAVGELVTKTAEAKKLAGDEIQRIDALLAAGWPDPKSRPPEVAKKRDELALSLACRAVRCKEEAVKKRWVFGTAAVTPVADPKAAKPTESLKSGSAVWELATGGGLSLVAIQEVAGPLDGLGPRAAVAFGWVPSKDLRDQDTSEMLPPGESLVGTRVWGPLREGEKSFELGTVTEAKGANVKVRRLADRKEVEVPRAKLRFGVTKQGTKVMGLCNKPDALEPALIDHVKEVHSEQLDPQVTLSCLDADGKVMGVLKDGVLGSLRMPPEWLK